MLEGVAQHVSPVLELATTYFTGELIISLRELHLLGQTWELLVLPQPVFGDVSEAGGALDLVWLSHGGQLLLYTYYSKINELLFNLEKRIITIVEKLTVLFVDVFFRNNFGNFLIITKTETLDTFASSETLRIIRGVFCAI